MRYFEKLGAASFLQIFLYCHKEIFMIKLIFPNYIMLCKMLKIMKLAIPQPPLFMLLTRLELILLFNHIFRSVSYTSS